MSLLLHPTTRYQLDALVAAQPHAVMVVGPTGSGKTAIAYELARRLLDIDTVTNYPYFLHIQPEKQTLGIEQIRQFKEALRRKTTGQKALRRIILLSDAHMMTIEAQNAVLKTLEEPPEDTALLLTTNDITALRPTIRSRAQQMLVQPVGQEEAKEYFRAQGFTNAEIDTAFYMSDGRVGLMAAILEAKGDHALVDAIQTAKKLLQMTVFERLQQVDSLGKDKAELQILLEALQRVISSGLKQATAKSNQAQVKRFYNLSRGVQTAQDAFVANTNTKLVLTDLFLNL
ncbi:MAG TPA: AAA family ATPase [Patescibacteria group bacterium]|nr:AAA family ATPase [Patescibacteria group bacterium]